MKNQENKKIIEDAIKSSTSYRVEIGNSSGTFQGYRIVFEDGVHVSFGCIDGEFDSIYAAILTVDNVITDIIWYNNLNNEIRDKIEIIVSNYLKDNLG